MAEREKRVMEILAYTIPKMTELERERLIGFAEGCAYKPQKGDEPHGKGEGAGADI